MMIFHADQVMLPFSLRLNLVAAHLVSMAETQRLLIIGYSIQFSAKHPIVDDILTDDRIYLASLG